MASLGDVRVMVFPDPERHAAGAARLVSAALAAATRPRLDLGLSGGTTPRRTYERLRWERVDWERVHAWLSDERWVPWDDADSNGRMAGEALLDHVPCRFHRPRWSPLLAPDDSAAHYEAELRGLLDDRRPTVVLLGMGEDGHTASLFPETDALDEEQRWYVANHVPAHDAWRLTATFPLLLRAELLMVLVTGEAKAAMVGDALEGDPGRLPVQRLGETEGDLLWLLDEAAASHLTVTPLERAD